MSDPDTVDDPDVVVLRQKVHGMGAEEYAGALRERLPGRAVVRAETPEEERELMRRAPVATGFGLDAEVLDGAALEYFACVFAGTGHLPLDALEERGVAVTNASGVHGPNIAEHVLGAMLVFARRFHEGWRRQSRREWRSYPTRELGGSTVTIVGLGAIGSTVVDRLEPFDVDTVGVRYHPERGGPTDEVLGFDDDLHAAFAATDYLVLAAPLSDTTRGLVDDEVFRTLPPEAVLVNVGRGPIVDTDDLLDALRSNAIRGAFLDVTDPEPLPEDHPLWGMENVVITPHNAGHTPAYWERMADIVAENLERASERGGYEDLRNQVL